MLFQFKMPENGRKNRFRDKQRPNNLPLMFLDVKILTEREILHFWNLLGNNPRTV